MEKVHTRNYFFDKQKTEYICGVDDAKVEKIRPKSCALSSSDRRKKLGDMSSLMKNINEMGGRIMIKKLNQDNEKEIIQRSYQVKYNQDRPSVAYLKSKINFIGQSPEMDETRKLYLQKFKKLKGADFTQEDLNNKTIFNKRFGASKNCCE